jgi:hypothetical protein
VDFVVAAAGGGMLEALSAGGPLDIVVDFAGATATITTRITSAPATLMTYGSGTVVAGCPVRLAIAPHIIGVSGTGAMCRAKTTSESLDRDPGGQKSHDHRTTTT